MILVVGREAEMDVVDILEDPVESLLCRVDPRARGIAVSGKGGDGFVQRQVHRPRGVQNDEQIRIAGIETQQIDIVGPGGPAAGENQAGRSDEKPGGERQIAERVVRTHRGHPFPKKSESIQNLILAISTGSLIHL
jgi:hypothetical protein